MKYFYSRGNRLFRFTDRYIGIMLIIILSFLKRKRQRPNKIIRIAISKFGAIGDLVIISALLNDLKKYNRNINITLIVGNDNCALIPLLKKFDTYIQIDISKPIKAIKKIRKENFDCFIDFDPWSRIGAIIAFFSNSQYVVGFKTTNQHRHFIYDQFYLHNDQIHELDNYRTIISQLFNIKCFSSPKLFIRNSKIFNKEKFVFIHMWPGGYNSFHKEWKKDNWQIIIQYLIRDKYLIVLSGTSENERDNDNFVSIFGQDNVLNIAGKYKLTDLASIMMQSIVVISVNTGIAHMSAALGRPTVCLNGPTSPIRWGPLGKFVKNINSTKEGAGFLNLGFEYDQGPNDTMDYISVESVLSHLSEQMNPKKLSTTSE